MARTIFSSYNSLLTLSGPEDDPATIISGALLNAGLYADSFSGSWSITNAARVLGVGIELAGTGNLVNAGVVASQSPAGQGVLLTAGGYVANTAPGTVSGSSGIVVRGGDATIVNSGSILGLRTDYSWGVTLAFGGKLINNASGIISGGINSTIALGRDYGVYVRNGVVANYGTIRGIGGAAIGVQMGPGASVTNASSATITGSIVGIKLRSGVGVIVNSGSIQGVIGEGIILSGTGTVYNAAGGSILGGRAGYGIEARAFGTVVNSGRITEITNPNGIGIAFAAGGVLNNEPYGTIEGYWYGVRIRRGASASVTNAGSIGALDGRGLVLAMPGTVMNYESGTISSGVVLAQGGAVLNSGTISDFGVRVAYSGSVTNAVHGTIAVAGPGAGVALSSGSVTNAGTIISTYAIPVYGVGVDMGQGTLTAEPTGVISAKRAVVFGQGFPNRLVDRAGATFVGTVDGGNKLGSTVTSVLELAAGNGLGTLSGLGSQFIDFGAVEIDPNATWVVGDALGTMADGAGTITLGQAATLEINGALGPFQVIAAAPLSRTTLNLDGGGEASATQLLIGGGNTLELGAAAGETPTFILSGDLHASATMVVDGSTVDLTAATSATFSAELQLIDGALLLGSNTVAADAGIQQAGGTIASAGTLTLYGYSALSGGLQTGSGTTRNLAFSSASGLERIDGGHMLQNDGVLSLNSGELQLGAGDASAAAHSGTLLNDGVLGIAGPVRISAPNGTGILSNTGLIVTSAGLAEAEIDASLDNTGIIEVRSGTLAMDGGGASFGAGLLVSVGATLRFGTPGSVVGETFSIRGAMRNAGTVAVGAGTVTVADAGNSSGIFLLDGTATLDFVNGTGSGTSLSFVHPGGTLVVEAAGGLVATLTGLASGDLLDAAPVSFATASATFALGTLTVSDGQNAVAFRLSGSYAPAGFHLANDGAGGTSITYG